MSKKKIYISPSNQNANKYAAGSTNEYVQCERIAGFLSSALIRCGFETKVAQFEQDIAARCVESNEWGADLHIPLHTNAGGGKGIEVYVYNTSTVEKNKEKQLAESICSAIKAISYTGVSRGVKTRALHELVNTPFSVYPEIEFHDNKKYAEWIIASVEQIGETLCKCICSYFGVKYVEKVTFKKGDYVVFTGDKHYKSATATKAYDAKPGTAEITAVKEGAAHPYHLVRDKNGESTVYGWVDANDVKEYVAPAPTYKKGDKITLTKEPLYTSATASKAKTTKTGVFYIYDGVKMNGRYRITSKEKYVGKTPAGLYVTGYVKAK